MLCGALLAAADDLSFDAWSYAVVLANDALTAARGVYVKALLQPSPSSSDYDSKKARGESTTPGSRHHHQNDDGGNQTGGELALYRKDSNVASPETTAEPGARLSKMSLLFYNALVSLVVVLPYLATTGAVAECRTWLDSRGKLLAFGLSASLGPVLQYAIFLCTQHNSALTTTVVGALKNIVTAYVSAGVRRRCHRTDFDVAARRPASSSATTTTRPLTSLARPASKYKTETCAS